MTIKQYLETLEKKWGKDRMKWAVVCPHCKTVQTPSDFLKAGFKPEEIERFWGYSCIGRYTDGKGCDWSLGGLFRIHELEIIDENGKLHPRMEIAEPPPDKKE